LDGDRALELKLKSSEAENITRLAFEKAIMKVRNRVDEYGAREPDIRPQGEDRIVVQLPGVIDAEKARKEIGRTGNLEFKLVDENTDPREALKGNLPPAASFGIITARTIRKWPAGRSCSRKRPCSPATT
jgi:preprotein translocase subunit SecD